MAIDSTEGLDTGVDTGASAPVEAPAEAPATSIRDDLEAAFAAAERDETGKTAPAPARERARDEAGRFTSEGKDATVKSVTEPAPRPQAAPSAEGQQVAAEKPTKAPGQWTPEAREKWAAVDPLVQREILRREAQFTQHSMSAAENRQFREAFESIVRPYEMFIRQENSNPLQAVQNLMQTAAELRVGTAQSKAILIANLIGQYGIDVQMLDSYLAHQRDQGVGWAAQTAPQPPRDPRVDQLFAMLQQQQQFQQQQQAQQINQEIEAFSAEHEFYDDVKLRMAALIEAEATQGRVLEMKDAYEIACQMDGEVRKIRASRQQSESVNRETQAAQRARRAASSVKGESQATGTVQPKDDSIRAALEAAWENASNRM